MLFVYGYLQFLFFKNFKHLETERGCVRDTLRQVLFFYFSSFTAHNQIRMGDFHLKLSLKRGYRFSALVTSPLVRTIFRFSTKV